MRNFTLSIQATRLFFTLALGLFLSMPCTLYAEELEIQLVEVSTIGTLPGDNPLDNPEQSVPEPPRPNDFRATITGRTLEITSGTHDARVIVRNSSNVQVLDRQFVGGTVEQLPLAGLYSLEIQSGSLTLVGAFEAE